MEHYKLSYNKNNVKWNELLNKLKYNNKNNSTTSITTKTLFDEYNTIMNESIRMCIDTLDQRLHQLYRKLAVFEQDVNIMPNTLKVSITL